MLTHSPFKHSALALMSIGTLMLVILCGCSKEKIQQVYQEAKAKTEQYTEQAVAKVEEKLPESGSIKLTSNDPVEKTKAANIKIIDIGDGRPASVQISSYDTSSDQRAYPAIYFHGQINAKTIAELANTTISCDMYIQTVYGGRIAATSNGALARLKFGSYDPEEGIIKATLSRTQLMLSDNKKFTVDGGEIIAVVQEQKE